MSDFGMMRWAGIILAAGKGTRMNSDLPKVLHQVAGRMMAARVIDAVRATGIKRQILVIGGDLEKFDPLLSEYTDLSVTVQRQRKGTADAVAAGGYGLKDFALPGYADGALLHGAPLDADYLLICTGDTPCLSAETLSDFLKTGLADEAPIGVIGMRHPQPTGYGRLILDQDGRLLKIVEEKDASVSEKIIDLCNSGIIYCRSDILSSALAMVGKANVSGEYYLTDIFEAAAKKGYRAFVYQTEKYQEFDGVNTPEQLKKVANWLKQEGRD
jgi:bifunctional UDP-N-acetylglucosamine pyrophosphorylase/glucosamine-1-phosphate N-acetyltransferase